jgi:hypothetical protein
MDQEEVLDELNKLVNRVGPIGEEIFDLAVIYNKVEMFNKLRNIIHEKDLAGDQIAVDTINWIFEKLSE